MAIRAVVLDLGDVLDRSGPPTWFDAWAARQGVALGSLDDVGRCVDDFAENVEAAIAAVIVGILHTDSATSIAAVERLLAASDAPPTITT